MLGGIEVSWWRFTYRPLVEAYSAINERETKRSLTLPKITLLQVWADTTINLKTG